MLLAMASGWRCVRLRSGAAKRKLVVLLVVVAALVIFAPTIVLNTPLRQRALTAAVPPAVGKLSVENLSIGWLTPLSATQVTLVDNEGNRLADVQRLTIDRTIVGLLSDSSDLGTIRLEGATIYALARADGSNLEDALARAVAPKSTEAGDLNVPSSGPSYRVEIVNSRVLSRDASTAQTWSIESVAATIVHPAQGPLSVEASGVVKPLVEQQSTWAEPSDATPGRFELRWGGDDKQQLGGVRLVCQDLPVEAMSPWLRRFDPQIDMVGKLTGEVSASFPLSQYDSLSGDTSGRISLNGFAVMATALEGERLAVDETNLAWKCTARGGRVSIENMSLASDVALFDLRGTMDEQAIRAVFSGAAETHALATGGDFEAEGKLNLARLAQRLPGLLQVREGTKITSGQVQFNARSMPQNGGHQITASLTTTPIAATTRGRAVQWDTPLDINVVARHAQNAWRFDRLSCQSQFLEVSGSGDARHMQLTGQVDLDELTSRLDQFVDLTEWQLAGRGELEAECQRDATGQFVAEGAGKLNDFVIAYRGEQLATEPQLNWTLRAEGASSDESVWPNRLASAELNLDATGDALAVQLTQPTLIEATWAATDWPLNIVSRGSIDSWARRLRPWVDLSAWNTSGNLELDARGRVRTMPLIVTVANSSMKIDQLRATTAEWQIEEPRVEWSGDIAWDSVTSTLVSRSGQLVSSSVAASFRDWFWSADPKQTSRVGGRAAVRANLGRLARAQRMPAGTPPRMLPLGEMSGAVKLAAQGDQVIASVDLSGENIQLQKPQPALPGVTPTLKTIWQEPKLRLVGAVSYTPQLDRLRFDGFQTQSSTLAIAASGSIDGLQTNQLVNLAGTVDYDLASLSPVLAQYVGEGLTIAGREQARFELKGALADLGDPGNLAVVPNGASAVQFSQASTSMQSKTEWYARVLAPWQSASLYGLPIGQGRISAELKEGRVAIEPLDFAVGGGRLTAAPTITTTPEPGELTLPAGPLLTNIRITPDVSERLIKFILPPLASATQTDGLFSMTLSGAKVPFGSPRSADVSGQLGVQSVRMVPGPALGGLVQLVREVEALSKARDLSALAQREPITLVSISDRSIDFRLVDGRVYHQGLEFQVGDVTVRSRGSVGLDETLSLMLELQVPEKWLGRRARSLSPGGLVLQVPVSGTLSNFRPDKSAALDSLKQQGISALGQLLDEETVGNALDKLFGGGR